MNRPFKNPLAGVSSPSPIVGTPATPHGTPLANNLRAEGEAGVIPFSSVSPTSIDADTASDVPSYPTGGAGASNASTICPDCEGEGESYWMALDATDYSLEECPFCDGTGTLHTQAMQSREAY